MKTIILFFLAMMAAPIMGQNSIDLVNVYWRTSPGNAMTEADGKMNMNMFATDVKLPLVIDKNNVVIVGGEYQQTNLVSSNDAVKDLQFSSCNLQLGLEHKWNDRSKMLFMSFTRLNSDFKNISSRHFQQGGLVLGTTARTSNFDWKYGLYYNAEFFGPMFVPLFGFNWKMNDKWRLKVVVPVNLELSYRPNERMVTGLRFDGVNASYRVTNNLVNTNNFVDKADNNLWVFAEFNLGKNIWFHAKAGHSILRKYRLYNEGDQMNVKLGPVNIGDNRPVSEASFENGLSFEARFIYRLPLD
jgi:hypothetical protein